jgi:hypothetical protein
MPSDDKKGVTVNNVVPGSNRLDITSFFGGTLFIGAWGAKPERVSEYADDVKAQPVQVDAKMEATRSFLNLQPGRDLED